MKKTLYSLMLNEDVVREVDKLAHRLGTNRSNLINEILAEYVDYTTPEKRINDVLSSIEELMKPLNDFVPFFTPHTYSMSLKSSLEYKYRPTIKYEVELNRGESDCIGKLSVVFRTQSQELINSMTDFFRLWKQLEDAHLKQYGIRGTEYSLYPGRFERTLAYPAVDCTAEDLAETISDYIQLFDKLMKGWLSGAYDNHDVEAAYYSFLTNSKVKI